MSTSLDLKNQGNAALSQGKYDQAIEFYTSAIKLDEKNHVLYSNRSAAHAKVGQYDDALKDAEQCVSLNPTWAKGYSRKGAALEFLGRLKEAEEAYLKAMDLEPSNEQFQESAMNVRARMALGSLPARVAAHPVLKDYLKDPDYVEKLRSLQENPALLQFLMKDSKIKETVFTLFTAQEPMDESSPPPSPPKKSEPKPKEPELADEEKEALKEKELGNAAYKKKDFQTAISHYDKAFELDPKNITFLTNKSAVYFEMGDYPKCIEVCEDAVSKGRELRSDYKLIAKAFARIAHCYENQGDLQNAKKYYDKSLSEFRAPDVIKKSQALDKKLKEMERQAYINPELAEAAKLEGNKAFEAGNYPLAMKHYTEAIKRNPEDPKLYSNRAACYTKLMEFPCALKDCETCISLAPDFIKGYLRKAACLVAMKDLNQARKAYRKALELEPTCEEARQGLIQCATSETDPEAARQRAMYDPEIKEILSDPAMRMILNQMEDPDAMKEHLSNPEIASKLMKLIDAGIVAIR
ncbi:Stress-induced-phosphoprotein 1 [Sparganum proliferum]